MYFVAKKAITKTRNLKNTKIFMIFFVVSTFRDFVIKDLFFPIYPASSFFLDSAKASLRAPPPSCEVAGTRE
ncbi:MAG: hypothetical protein DRH90_12350 [Deltaproteobacteria bacterium]|nr:MAG: hypothetical protein DRH90_12350 [Deltaproteobacteria bacterium]RLC16392.1 MAG: hypothetical protein DRI24_08535 [Deltaproteobacteria bacterium]